MKVSDLLESRKTNWRELEALCKQLEGRSRRGMPAPLVAKFSALYRAACADLALADAYQLPVETVRYLHQLARRRTLVPAGELEQVHDTECVTGKKRKRHPASRGCRVPWVLG